MDSKNSSQFGFIDIFFFVLFITAIAIFLGLSIVTVIDKKINNVSINMPTIEPKVVLNVNKDKNGNIKISQKNNKNTIEEFIVSDAHNIQHYDQLREATLELPDNFDMENLDNPENKDGIDYDKDNPIDNLPEQVVHHITEPKQPNGPTIIIDRSVPGGAESMNVSAIQVGSTLPTAVPPANIGYPSAHTVPTILKEMTASKHETIDPNKVLLPPNPNPPNMNYITADDFGMLNSPAQYVKCKNGSIKQVPNKSDNHYDVHFLGQTIPMDDYTTKGYNYWEYGDDVNPRTIRYQRILSQNTKGLPPEDTRYKNIPVGWNYAFHNTPAILP